MKAVIVNRKGKFPPRIHNLLRLAQVADIVLEPNRKQFLGDLTGFYIQPRYPEEIESLGTGILPETAGEVLGKTREMVKWLSSMLK